MSKFDDSLAGGAHAWLAQFTGNWAGTAKTWFEPDVLADTSPIRGTLRSVLSGRFLLHEYSGTLVGETMEGVALYGCDLAAGHWLAAWVDSCHNGTTIMLSRLPCSPGSTFNVLGSYPDGQGGPEWGWRTTLAALDPDHIVIAHYNITPGGEEAQAVEIDYRRA